MKLGIQTLQELREYLPGTTDGGGVSVNRGLLRQLLEAVSLLQQSHNAWENEEDSVKEEHEELISDISDCLERLP
jgi:hypothetical protein